VISFENVNRGSCLGLLPLLIYTVSNQIRLTRFISCNCTQCNGLNRCLLLFMAATESCVLLSGSIFVKIDHVDKTLTRKRYATEHY